MRSQFNSLLESELKNVYFGDCMSVLRHVHNLDNVSSIKDSSNSKAN